MILFDCNLFGMLSGLRDFFVTVSHDGSSILSPNGEFLVKIVFPVLGGIVGLIGVYLLYQRTSAILKQTIMSEKHIQAEHFKNAIEHLGNDKHAVILGGIQALHNLAANNRDYRKQVFEIFCSFIRQETSDPRYKAMINADYATSPHTSTQQESKVDDNACPPRVSKMIIQTILDKLFKDTSGKRVYGGLLAALNGSCLRGMYLYQCDLEGAALNACDLRDVDFEYSNLDYSKFAYAIVDNSTKFREASLRMVTTNRDLSRRSFWKKVANGTATYKSEYDNLIVYGNDEKPLDGEQRIECLEQILSGSINRSKPASAKDARKLLKKYYGKNHEN